MDMLCKALVVLLHYFHVSTFFWMFIEGLYLHTICVWAFSADRIQLAYFVIIAWGNASHLCNFFILRQKVLHHFYNFSFQKIFQ